MSAPDATEAPGITFVINTYNHAATIAACLQGVLAQQFHLRHEIIVVDDGSTDGTLANVEAAARANRDRRWHTVRLARAGGVACRQHGINLARYELILLLGGDFILCDPTAVATMHARLTPELPFVSLYGPHGGMGTLYRRSTVLAVGGFSLAFNRFGSGFRDDSDLHYRLQRAGQTGRHLPDLHTSYRHQQPRTPGIHGALAYAHHRVAVHQLDPLLFKRHPAQFARDFPLVAGRIVSPRQDFRRATGRWQPGGQLNLSSPQGVVLIAGDSALGRLAAILSGLAYVVAVHAARIWGSVTYRTLLL